MRESVLRPCLATGLCQPAGIRGLPALRGIEVGEHTADERRTCYVLTMSIQDLQHLLRDFVAERDWEQFHTPKNLVMALAGEVGELTEIFQWLTPEQSATVLADPARATQVREEIADIFAYLLRLADVLGVDLEASLLDKTAKNAAKYPVETARGTADKYTDLGEPGKP